MVQIKSGSSIKLEVQLILSEPEVRALQAITEYGIVEFTKCFYSHLGKGSLEENEDGLCSLFITIKEELPRHLVKIDKARKVLQEKSKI